MKQTTYQNKTQGEPYGHPTCYDRHTSQHNALCGEEGCELSKSKYGVDEWWLLLEPVAAAEE